MPQLTLIHSEIVAEFVDDRQADLFPDLGLGGADSFDVLLIENDVIGPGGQVKDALPGCGNSMEKPQKKFPSLSRLWRRLVRWHVLHQNTHIVNASAKFLWEGIEHALDDLHKTLTFHLSPTEYSSPAEIKSTPTSPCHSCGALRPGASVLAIFPMSTLLTGVFYMVKDADFNVPSGTRQKQNA